MNIKSEIENLRIDKYLASITDYSRTYINKLIDLGKISVNGAVIKASYLVQIDDNININDDLVVNNDLLPENIDLNIVYEDQYLLIINKPSGMVVHPGNGNNEHTLVNALINYTNNLSDIDDVRPGIVHRIDKDTSGLLIVAKTNKAHQLLSDMISKKEVKREYIALIKGVFMYDTADIDAPIGRDKKNRQKMAVVAENSKSAKTHLEVIKRYKNYTLVKLLLETGRTHQIRVHMSYIGYPIFNDPIYTNDNCTEFGQFLHSSSIEFTHPITQEHLIFSCPLPEEFTKYLNTLEEI